MARKNPRRNITRVETVSSNDKVYGGWEVRMQRRKRKMSRFFSDLSFGGKRAALQAAKAYRDSLERYNKKYTVGDLAKNPSVRNSSGQVGVRLKQQKDQRGDFEYTYWYWVAQWTDGRGNRKTRSFSVHQHGDDEAYRLACAAREAGIRQLKR